jgi:hypothetical protein
VMRPNTRNMIFYHCVSSATVTQDVVCRSTYLPRFERLIRVELEAKGREGADDRPCTDA